MALPSLNGSAAAGTGATIATKYGPARQSSSSAARSALIEAENGATVYRVGTLGVQHIEEGQFWALRNPLSTVGYAEEYGLPTASVGYRFVVGGTVKDSAVIITREALGIGVNAGGAIEVVTPIHGVRIDWFHMP